MMSGDAPEREYYALDMVTTRRPSCYIHSYYAWMAAIAASLVIAQRRSIIIATTYLHNSGFLLKVSDSVRGVLSV